MWYLLLYVFDVYLSLRVIIFILIIVKCYSLKFIFRYIGIVCLYWFCVNKGCMYVCIYFSMFMFVILFYIDGMMYVYVVRCICICICIYIVEISVIGIARILN